MNYTVERYTGHAKFDEESYVPLGEGPRKISVGCRVCRFEEKNLQESGTVVDLHFPNSWGLQNIDRM